MENHGEPHGTHRLKTPRFGSTNLSAARLCDTLDGPSRCLRLFPGLFRHLRRFRSPPSAIMCHPSRFDLV